MKRKTRVTKDERIKMQEQLSLTSAQKKAKIIPGPWTNLTTELTVQASLKLNPPVMLKDPCLGAYVDTEEWHEPGWYPIIINIIIPELPALALKHDMNHILAAAERSLNAPDPITNKPPYGNLILLQLTADQSQNPNPAKQHLSCRAKTNKKYLSKFRAVRLHEGKMRFITLP